VAREYGLAIKTADSSYGTIAYLSSASNISIKYSLSGTSTLDCTFSADSADGQALYDILNGTTSLGIEPTIPVVEVSRDGVVVFEGPMVSLDMDVSEGATISAAFSDWTGLFDHWWAYGIARSSTANLIMDTVLGLQAGTAGTTYLAKWPFGIAPLTRTTIGTITPTCTVNANEQTSAKEVLEQAAQTCSFDWYVNHSSQAFTMASTLGSDKRDNVKFGIGGGPGGPTIGNASSARVTFRSPRNLVFAQDSKNRIKESPNTWDPALISTYPASGATYKSLYNFGEYFEKVDAGSDNAQSVANTWRKDSPRQTVSLSVDPALSPVWGPSSDYYLGDTVKVTVSTAALTVDEACRVNEIAVSLDDNLVEVSNELTFEVLV